MLVCNSACDLQLAPSVAAMINFNFGNHIQHQTAKRGMLVPGPTQRDNLQVDVKVEWMPRGHGCQMEMLVSKFPACASHC